MSTEHLKPCFSLPKAIIGHRAVLSSGWGRLTVLGSQCPRNTSATQPRVGAVPPGPPPSQSSLEGLNKNCSLAHLCFSQHTRVAPTPLSLILGINSSHQLYSQPGFKVSFWDNFINDRDTTDRGCQRHHSDEMSGFRVSFKEACQEMCIFRIWTLGQTVCY